MTQLEAIYREALENIKNTLDGCGMRQDEEMPLSELLLLRVAREALSAQKPPTETQERCPKCKTEVEWVVPPIPGVKPFFQCQDPDCNWMSDDDFPERKSI